jgi:hypothetical protein
MGIYQAGELLASFQAPEPALDITLLIAFELAFLGLLGLYQDLQNERPRLALAGVSIVALAAVSILIVTGSEYVLRYVFGSAGDQPPAYLIPFQILYFLGIPLSFLVVGGASIRTRTPSRLIGGLLVLIGASWLVVLTGSTVLIDAAGYLFGGLMLAVGLLLRTNPRAITASHQDAETAGD